MAKSIDLGGDIFLDASAVTMNSSGRTLKESLPTMRQFSDTIAHTYNRTYIMTPGTRGILITTSGYTDLRSAYIFHAETSGNVRTSAMCAASGISLSSSTNGLTVTNNSANDASVDVSFFIFLGSISTPE